MRRVTLEVQGRSGRCLNLVTTAGEVSTKALLRLAVPDLDDAERSSPAASFLRLNRDPANNVLRFLGAGEDWLNVEMASRGGRAAVAASPSCWRREPGGKEAYLARRSALLRVSRAFEVGARCKNEKPAGVGVSLFRRCLSLLLAGK